MSATVAQRRVFDAFLGDDLRRRRSTTGTPTAGTRSPPPSRCATSSCSTSGTCSPTSAPGRPSCAGLLDESVAPLHRVARGPPAGLMAGVELAPPADGLRWGRRVCARPPSSAACSSARSATSSCSCRRSRSRADELDRIVDVLADAHRRGDRGRDAGRAGPRRATRTASARAGRWRTVRDLDAGGPAGRSLDGRPVVSFASNDYLGLTAAPGGGRRRARRARPVGHRVGLGPAHRRRPPGPRRARGRRWPLEADRGGRCCSRPASPPTSACSPRSAARRASSCSDELNHASIIDGCRLAARRGRGLPPPRPRPPRRACSPAATSRAVVVTDTVFSMDGDVADRRRPRRACAPATARSSCSTRPTPCSARTSTRRRAVDVAAGRHALEDARLARRLRGRPGGARRAARERAPARTSSRPRRRRPTPRPRSPRSGSLRSRRGRRPASRGSGATSTGSGPGHPSPIVPVVLGDEDAPSPRRPRCSTQGLLVPGHPPADRAAGTSRLRVTLSAAHTRRGRRPARSPRCDELGDEPA